MKRIILLLGLGLSALEPATCENLFPPNKKLDMIWSASTKALVGELRGVELIALDIRVPVIRCVIVESSDRSEYTLYWPRNVYGEKSSQIVIHERRLGSATNKDEFSRIQQLFNSLWKTEPEEKSTSGLDGFSFILRKYSAASEKEFRWTNASGSPSILEKELLQFSRDFEIFNGLRPDAQ